MTGLVEGEWVRYSDDFCRQTSTTAAGERDVAARRGLVLQVFDDGKLCNVDWGDCIVQFRTDSPSVVASSPPRACASMGEGPHEVEPDASFPLVP